MKVFGLLFMFCFCVSFIEADFDVGDLAKIILGLIGPLFAGGPVPILDHACQYKVTPKISKLQLKYDGEVWCPGWTDVRGKSTTEGQTGAVEKALEDFINKAVKAGVITEQQAEDWLKKYKG